MLHRLDTLADTWRRHDALALTEARGLTLRGNRDQVMQAQAKRADRRDCVC